MTQDTKREALSRSVAQFFFEVGYVACWADAYAHKGSPAFPLSDEVIEKAWQIAGEAHDDPEEFDRYLALSTHPTPTAEQGGEDLRAAIRNEIINAPETADFMAGVPLEAAHQRERWGVSHDAGKSPFDWFWLIGYLSQKAADADVRGDTEKAKHHTISTAAALANWHAALAGKSTAMRPGIDPATLTKSNGDPA